MEEFKLNQNDEHGKLCKSDFSIRDYELKERIPFGRTGFLFICTRKKTTKLYFMKILTKSTILSIPNYIDKVYQQIKFHAMLRS